MSRLVLLLIFALWLVNATAQAPPTWSAQWSLGVFFGGYAVLVGGVGAWARMLSRQVGSIELHASLRRFNRMLAIARALVPGWLAFGLFGPVGWGHWVLQAIGPYISLNIRHAAGSEAALAMPGMVIGTLPAMLAWMGLWWAQFPADRALREQSLLAQLDQNLPVHAPPRFRQYLAANFRQQLLFMGLPVVLILLVRDMALVGVRLGGWRIGHLDHFEDWVTLPAAGVVFVLAPEILRRVLHTRPLPDSALRRRLEQICRRVGLRYRDILLWQTQYSMGNAAVMGLVPQMRYVLLSDLLLETLSDQQIEAVFAHETGHIVHRHMAWYVVFFGILTLAALGPGRYIDSWAASQGQRAAAGSDGRSPRDGRGRAITRPEAIRDTASAAVAFTAVMALFGYLSRRFERQADVFAARMLESNWGMGREPSAGEGPPGATAAKQRSHVGEHGAAVFTSALRRVAAVNNIPVGARSWCHGSMARRMEYLDDLSADPALTGDFDRLMSRLYVTMLVLLIGCAAMAAAAR